MTLIICVDDPTIEDGSSDGHYQESAGFESYRKTLWGTEAIKKRAPLLAEIENNLFVYPEQFERFESECLKVESDADEISREIGWGDDGCSSIRRYINNFLSGLEFARKHNSKSIIIW